jgi:hypothetical protein
MFLVLNLGPFVATEGLGEVSVFPSGVMEVIEKAELLVEGEWKLRFSLPLKSLNFIFFLAHLCGLEKGLQSSHLESLKPTPFLWVFACLALLTWLSLSRLFGC